MDSAVSTSRRAKVLVATASVGAGHNSAARAIVAGLKRRAPDVDVRYLDVLTLTPWLFRLYYAGGYAVTVTRFGFFYGIAYWLTNRPHTPRRSIMERRRLWTERLAMTRVADYLLDYRPDVVVNTHFLVPPLLAGMVRSNKIDTRQMVVLTDNDPHRYWYSEHVDRWFIAGEHLRQGLRRWGVTDEQIVPGGIPVHPKWTQSIDREKALADWNLPADKDIVLLSGGTEFTCAPVARIAREIVARCDNALVLVLGGNNKRLLARVARLGARCDRIRGVSFTDRLHELAEVSSLIVTKAGGITTAECLARAKPMVLLKPIPGQEAANAAHFEREGAATVVRSRRASAVAAEAARVLGDRSALAGLGDNARRPHLGATETIVDHVLATLADTRSA